MKDRMAKTITTRPTRYMMLFMGEALSRLTQRLIN
jgi:hypothetical protein